MAINLHENNYDHLEINVKFNKNDIDNMDF